MVVETTEAEESIYSEIESSNDYILEVGNLGDTEAADNADFNALEVPPGGMAKSRPSYPTSLVP